MSNSEFFKWCHLKEFSLENYGKYIEESARKGHLTNDGPLQRVLAEKLKHFLGCQNEVMLAASGTSALHALVAGWNIKLGRQLRWCTQAFTFPSSMQGPLHDSIVIDQDEELFGPCLTKATELVGLFDGIIVTNVFGLRTNLLAYEKWCKDHGKLLVFDNAATPIGTLPDGRSIHDVGDGAIISLHETKPIGRGEGGAVVAPKAVTKFVHQAMNFGFDVLSPIRIPHRYASNWRMSDIAGAAICDHLDRVISEGWISKHEILVRHAVAELKQVNLRLRFPVLFPTLLSTLFIALPFEGDAQVERLSCLLHSNLPSVEAKRYYRPLVDRQNAYDKVGVAPVAWKWFDSSICVPFHVGFTKKMITDQISMLHKAIGVLAVASPKHGLRLNFDQRAVHVIGSGGHAKVVLAALRALQICCGGVYDSDKAKLGLSFEGNTIQAMDKLQLLPLNSEAFIAIGSNDARCRIAKEFPNLRWATIVHPSASVDPTAVLAPGTLVNAQAAVMVSSKVGAHAIINTSASIDHDCVIGDFAHIAPGVHLCGNVRVGEGTLLGVGTACIPGLCIGEWCTIGAGSTVLRDVSSKATAYGSPAKEQERRSAARTSHTPPTKRQRPDSGVTAP